MAVALTEMSGSVIMSSETLTVPESDHAHSSETPVQTQTSFSSGQCDQLPHILITITPHIQKVGKTHADTNPCHVWYYQPPHAHTCRHTGTQACRHAGKQARTQTAFRSVMGVWIYLYVVTVYIHLHQFHRTPP